MRKPKDPRHHGLQEPQKVLSKIDSIIINEMIKDSKVSLHALFRAWNKTLNDIHSQGLKIKEGPHLVTDGFYRKNVSIYYTVEWDNKNYEAQKVEYDMAIANYEEQLVKFEAYEQQRKTHIPGLDEKIARTEQRLANLKAHRDGQPLPFPE